MSAFCCFSQIPYSQPWSKDVVYLGWLTYTVTRVKHVNNGMLQCCHNVTDILVYSNIDTIALYSIKFIDDPFNIVFLSIPFF